MLLKFKKVNFKIVTYKTLICCFCLLLSIFSSISLYTHNDFDPSMFTVNDDIPLNALGVYGANVSSLLLVILGDASWLILCYDFYIRVIVLKEYNFLNLPYAFRINILYFFYIYLPFCFSLILEFWKNYKGKLGLYQRFK